MLRWLTGSAARDADALRREAERHLDAGAPRAAIPALERAVKLQPAEAGGWHALAVACLECGELERAESAARKVLEIDPRHAKALTNLGAVLQRVGRYDEAIAAYRQAVEASPELGHAWFNLGTLLLNQGRPSEAIEPLRTSCAIDPSRADWRTALGSAYDRSGYPVDAVAAFERALALDPRHAAAEEGLAICLVNIGEVERAMPHFERALQLDPGLQTARSNRLFALNYCVEDGEKLHAEHANWGRVLAASVERRTHRRSAQAQRALVVGYVSPDLRSHAVAHFLLPVLAHHDRNAFRVICYSDAESEDAMSERLRATGAQWRRTTWTSDEALAGAIAQDGVDILVDLAGHTGGGHRMALFARKPAPVQVTWLGYPNTTGLEAMDYRLTDAVADPEGETERFHTERLFRLPNGFLCYGPPAEAPAVSDAPLLRAGRATFGSFNNLSKLTAGVIELWCSLLQRSPGSRLMLKSTGLAGASAREALRARFAQHGVGGERLEILGPDPSFPAHLARYAEVDVALDTFPYNGTTTTCEALWMGVPVVALQGRTHVARVGASLLRRVGLQELVAHTPEKYVELAAGLAADRARLQALRAGLRARLQASPLLDAAGFTRSLEAAYRSMWQAWNGSGA